MFSFLNFDTQASGLDQTSKWYGYSYPTVYHPDRWSWSSELGGTNKKIYLDSYFQNFDKIMNKDKLASELSLTYLLFILLYFDA